MRNKSKFEPANFSTGIAHCFFSESATVVKEGKLAQLSSRMALMPGMANKAQAVQADFINSVLFKYF
jgi:hypothetical protein